MSKVDVPRSRGTYTAFKVMDALKSPEEETWSRDGSKTGVRKQGGLFFVSSPLLYYLICYQVGLLLKLNGNLLP